MNDCCKKIAGAIIEEAQEPCPHVPIVKNFKQKRDCDKCWQQLKKEILEKDTTKENKEIPENTD